ncbi:MAG: hypothetical protein QG671_1004 [Actinomycetota bacterium]|nr:hypothetical protein [Actinomycetota bacterium]HQZ85290.1 DUF302 domain-containing protein [Actinomycetota bacterium]
MSYGMSTTVDRPFDEVLADVRGALAAQGFGIITEIDIKKTLHTKIGADVDEQVILGACSPNHAYRALQAEPSIGLLLPCNVVVRATDEGTVVDMINPQMMVELTSSEEMAAVADEVNESLSAALASLSQ